MKKKVWIVILVILLLCLVIPVPTGVYKDGGTRVYTALSYKIVKWNHIYGEGSIYNKTKIYPFPMNFMSLDSLLSKEEKNFEITNNLSPNRDHAHQPAEKEQTVSEPVIDGYCGNTQTTIYFDGGQSLTFMYSKSVTMTDILINLEYDKSKLCKCLPEYTVDTEFGTGYGINLTEGYARCDKGQADLTKEQIDKLEEIVQWAESEAGVQNKKSNFEFSLTWGTYGYSSYDSKSGTLVKTTDATNPKDYTTELQLTEQQYSHIWKLIKMLDIESYPDEYNPHGNGVSTPYMTLILSVKTDEFEKTVTVKETVLSYETNNKKGQKFLDVCKGIRDILTETDEWKSLPEYEFFYD